MKSEPDNLGSAAVTFFQAASELSRRSGGGEQEKPFRPGEQRRKAKTAVTRDRVIVSGIDDGREYPSHSIRQEQSAPRRRPSVTGDPSDETLPALVSWKWCRCEPSWPGWQHPALSCVDLVATQGGHHGKHIRHGLRHERNHGV